jgi:hypothetical protein
MDSCVGQARFLGKRVISVAAWVFLLGAFWVMASGFVAAQPKDGAKAGGSPEKTKRGLLVNEPQALQGYTLLAPIMSTKAFLLDMQGRVVRSWKSESSTALTNQLLENGHLLRHAKLSQQAFGDGPGAGGHIQEFGWNGEVVWDFKLANANQLAHHDVCKLPNGNVLLIVWEKKSTPEAIAAGRRPETVGKDGLLPDSIVEVQPTGKTTGKIVWEWHVWDHLIQDQDPTKANYGDVSAHPELVDVNFGEGTLASIIAKPEELEKLRAIGYVGSATPGKPAPVRVDWLHTNAVAYNPDLDQIMMSIHEFSEIWVIDHSTTTAEAASHKGGKSGKGGDLLYRWGNPRAYRAGTIKDQKLFHQHNAHWIPRGLPGEGHVLIFNNGMRRPGGAYSTVDEIVPPVDQSGHYAHKPGTAYGPDKPVWSYSAPKRIDFYASFISGANRLPNGNTLICEGPTGTIFEVTPNKEVVWKYLNPVKPDPPPGMGGPPQAVEVMAAFLRESVKATEEQAKQFDELRKEAESKLDGILTPEQKKKLQEVPESPGPAAGPPPTIAPAAAQILAGPVRQRLKLTDEQKKQVEELQKETEAKVDKTLTADQKKQLKKIRESFVNAWAGGAPPPGRPGAPPAGGGAPNLSIAVFRCYRYPANYPGLAGKDLTPGKTIEELQAQATQGK